MADKTKKDHLLHFVSISQTPISIGEILQALGDDYKERSVRRWLKELIDEGKIERIGSLRSSKYQVFTLEKKKEFLTKPPEERTACTYDEVWVQDYIPNQNYNLPNEVREELHLAGARFSKEAPAGTYARQIYDRLLIDLSYNSSRLEGNTYSLLDTKELLLEGKWAEGKLEEESVMILNHKEAIRYLVEKAKRVSISDREVCTLHYLLSEGLVPAQAAGKVRTHSVRIGGSSYLPIANQKKLEFFLQYLCTKAEEILDPFEQSFFLLVHISYLQAFVDVNKRTARLCCNIPLIQNNLVPLSFNGIEPSLYIDAMLLIYEQNDVSLLRELFVRSYMQSCEIYGVTLQSLGFDAIRVQYREERRSILRHVIVNLLSKETLRHYVHAETDKQIPPKDQAEFLEDVWEDLEEIGPTRIAGLGITDAELNAWLSMNAFPCD